MNLGILGGTFDPPHLGHLVLADQCANTLNLDRVLFIPAYLPPHKLESVGTPYEIRLEMIKAAISGNPLFQCLDLEGRRRGISYTVDTLRDLLASSPEDDFYLLMGQDSLSDMPDWKDPETIASLAKIGVYRRPGAYEPVPPWLEERVKVVDGPQIDVSSTELRINLGVGTGMRYLIPEDVYRIIRREGLYQGR